MDKDFQNLWCCCRKSLDLSQKSSFEVEFKEKLYEKYFQSQKYLIQKEEYYKILENLKTATEVSDIKSHHQ